MIVRDRSQWLRLIFSWKGSVFSHIWRRVAFVTLVSLVVNYGHHTGALQVNLTPLPFTLIGLALSIFLGFRNNTSYDRFWEGRKLWGRIVNTSRTLTRQILTFVGPVGEAPSDEVRTFQRETVYRLIAYVHALRLHLRPGHDYSELAAFIPKAEAEALGRESNPPVALLQSLGERFRAARDRGWIDAYHAPVLEDSLTQFTDIQGGCERIRATPIPFGYGVLMHRVVAFYCLGLPFGIDQAVGPFAPLVVLLISYAFFGLDALGDEIEDPFGTDPNDLPLSQLSRMIEINLRERLGETELPEPVKPVDWVLS